MPGSPSTAEKAADRRAITQALTDQKTALTLQKAGDSSRSKRDQLKAERRIREQIQEREEREQKEKVAESIKCMISPSLPPSAV